MGTLHIVATPIGNLEDVTLCALRVLREAELVLAEDTRHTRVLLDRHRIDAHLLSLHQHNEAQRSEQALAARDNGVPFYAALPYSTIDWTLADGAAIPIEERDPAEVATMRGRGPSGQIIDVEVLPPGTAVANPAFDVTPAHLVTGIVTERGVCEASREGLLALYPERRKSS